MIRDTTTTRCTRTRYVSKIYHKCMSGIDTRIGPAAPANATCSPSVGLFLYSYDRGHNYSEAESACTKHGGLLADVLSEARTNYLSTLVQQFSSNTTINAVDSEIPSTPPKAPPNNTPIRHAFVGLRETERGGQFTSSQSKPIECFRYRAWAPRFPRSFSFHKHLRSNNLTVRIYSISKKRGCVAITDEGSWKMFDCRKRMPFICELHPSGPSKKKINLNRKCSIKRSNNVA